MPHNSLFKRHIFKLDIENIVQLSIKLLRLCKGFYNKIKFSLIHFVASF